MFFGKNRLFLGKCTLADPSAYVTGGSPQKFHDQVIHTTFCVFQNQLQKSVKIFKILLQSCSESPSEMRALF
jgi:hypothetical protein